MGSFWEFHFIDPPEVQGQVVGPLIYGLENDDAKVSKSSIWVNGKSRSTCGEYAPPLLKSSATRHLSGENSSLSAVRSPGRGRAS